MPFIEDTVIILCFPEQDYLRLILDLLCACMLNVFPWKIENSNIGTVWDSGKCDTDHSLYVVGGISVNMSNTLVITLQKNPNQTKTNKKRMPKGYKQETVQACCKTCYWVIVTYSLLLSCHCILSFNKIWAGLVLGCFIFLLYQLSSFGRCLMTLWILFIML